MRAKRLILTSCIRIISLIDTKYLKKRKYVMYCSQYGKEIADKYKLCTSIEKIIRGAKI